MSRCTMLIAVVVAMAAACAAQSVSITTYPGTTYITPSTINGNLEIKIYSGTAAPASVTLPDVEHVTGYLLIEVGPSATLSNIKLPKLKSVAQYVYIMADGTLDTVELGPTWGSQLTIGGLCHVKARRTGSSVSSIWVYATSIGDGTKVEAYAGVVSFVHFPVLQSTKYLNVVTTAANSKIHDVKIGSSNSVVAVSSYVSFAASSYGVLADIDAYVGDVTGLFDIKSYTSASVTNINFPFLSKCAGLSVLATAVLDKVYFSTLNSQPLQVAQDIKFDTESYGKITNVAIKRISKVGGGILITGSQTSFITDVKIGTENSEFIVLGRVLFQADGYAKLLRINLPRLKQIDNDLDFIGANKAELVDIQLGTEISALPVSRQARFSVDGYAQLVRTRIPRFSGSSSLKITAANNADIIDLYLGTEVSGYEIQGAVDLIASGYGVIKNLLLTRMTRMTTLLFSASNRGDIIDIFIGTEVSEVKVDSTFRFVTSGYGLVENINLPRLKTVTSNPLLFSATNNGDIRRVNLGNQVDYVIIEKLKFVTSGYGNINDILIPRLKLVDQGIDMSADNHGKIFDLTLGSEAPYTKTGPISFYANGYGQIYNINAPRLKSAASVDIQVFKNGDVYNIFFSSQDTLSIAGRFFINRGGAYTTVDNIKIPRIQCTTEFKVNAAGYKPHAKNLLLNQNLYSQVNDAEAAAIAQMLQSNDCAATVSFWKVGPWSECSTQCGPGTKTRDVECVGSCSGLVKPDASDDCILATCFDWVRTTPQACPAEPDDCGASAVTRVGEVKCFALEAGPESEPLVLAEDETSCEATKPQPIVNECPPVVCENKWSTTEWSSCSRVCGPETRTRSVTCPTNYQCSETKPAEQSDCGNQDCEWFTTPPSEAECPTECIVPTPTLTGDVGCRGQEDGKAAPESYCDTNTKPLKDVVACDDAMKVACRVDWQATGWTECDAPCGEGAQKRSVTCPADASLGFFCDGYSKPPSVQGCSAAEECEWVVPEDAAPCSDECALNEYISLSSNVFCRTADSHVTVSSGPWCGSKPDRHHISCPATEPCPWDFGEWSGCSSTCGAGERTRSVVCNSAVCTVPKPDTTQPCDTPCQWVEGDWGECSESCGIGSQTRSVTCPGTTCVGDAPKDEQQCGSPCQWVEGEWGECSESCGIGSQTRTVSCPGTTCEGNPPSTEQECGSPCQWVAGEWGTCSVECGVGEQTRSVSCPGTTCEGQAPATTQECTQKCGDWVVESCDDYNARTTCGTDAYTINNPVSCSAPNEAFCTDPKPDDSPIQCPALPDCRLNQVDRSFVFPYSEGILPLSAASNPLVKCEECWLSTTSGACPYLCHGIREWLEDFDSIPNNVQLAKRFPNVWLSSGSTYVQIWIQGRNRAERFAAANFCPDLSAWSAEFAGTSVPSTACGSSVLQALVDDPATEQSSSSASSTPIIGAAAAGVVLLAVVLALVMLRKRREQGRKNASIEPAVLGAVTNPSYFNSNMSNVTVWQNLPYEEVGDVDDTYGEAGEPMYDAPEGQGYLAVGPEHEYDQGRAAPDVTYDMATGVEKRPGAEAVYDMGAAHDGARADPTYDLGASGSGAKADPTYDMGASGSGAKADPTYDMGASGSGAMPGEAAYDLAASDAPVADATYDLGAADSLAGHVGRLPAYDIGNSKPVYDNAHSIKPAPGKLVVDGKFQGSAEQQAALLAGKDKYSVDARPLQHRFELTKPLRDAADDRRKDQDADVYDSCLVDAEPSDDESEE